MDCPDELRPVPRALLEKLAAQAPGPGPMQGNVDKTSSQPAARPAIGVASEIGLDGTDAPIHRFLARLGGASPSGRSGMKWEACCPAHEDRKASLSIGVAGDGRVLLHCHAGCEWRAVLGILGLTGRDLFPREGEQASADDPSTAPPATFGDTDWEALASKATAEAEKSGALPILAQKLGVTEGSLAGLGVGFESSRHAWTFPERDGRGRIIGVALRYADGRKGALSGSKRGLTYPAEFGSLPDPVFVVEGGSDAAAMGSLALEAVGRPSSTGGLDALIELLAAGDRSIVVVGERDQKVPGGPWPGRDGAIRTAVSLSAALGRPVAWGLPPGDFKDSRAWLSGQTPVLEDRDSLEELGAASGPRSWPGLGRSCRRPSRSAGGASSGTSGSDADGSSWTRPPASPSGIPTLCHQTILAGGFERTLTICEWLN